MSHSRMHSDCLCMCVGGGELQRQWVRAGAYDCKLVIRESTFTFSIFSIHLCPK